jgi:hypothetical protein
MGRNIAVQVGRCTFGVVVGPALSGSPLRRGDEIG